MLEGSNSPSKQLIFGTLPGWWRFTDENLRVDGPLLDEKVALSYYFFIKKIKIFQNWRKAFQETGFSECSVLHAGSETIFIVQKEKLKPVPTWCITCIIFNR